MALAGTITFFDFRTTSFQPASGTPAAVPGTVPEAAEVGTGTFLLLAGPPVLGLVCLFVLDFLLLLLLLLADVVAVVELAIAVLDGVEGADDEEKTETEVVTAGVPKVLGIPPGVACAVALIPAAAEAASFSAACSPLKSFLSLASIEFEVAAERLDSTMFLFFLFFLAALAIVFLFIGILMFDSSLIGGCSASINLVLLLDREDDDEDEMMVFELEEELEVLLMTTGTGCCEELLSEL